MKLKHLVGIAFIVAVGGFFVYHFLNRKDNTNTSNVSGNGKKSEPEEQVNKDFDQVDSAAEHEEMCDATMRQVYDNMSARNEEAKQILSNIHDDMKKSEDNITAKKADIQKVMANLKK